MELILNILISQETEIFFTQLVVLMNFFSGTLIQENKLRVEPLEQETKNGQLGMLH
jgi:hypothetical protein